MSEIVDRCRIFGETPAAVERIAPGFFPKALEAAHVTRYRWAARYVNGLRVLDVACGTGYGTEILRAAGTREVVGVDINADALTFGVARHGLRAIRGDAQALPFAARTFDAAVSFETVEHLADPKRFLQEVCRILQPGGVLILSTPNAELASGYNPYHLNELTLPQLLDLCGSTGFVSRQIRGQNWRLRGSAFDRIRGFRRFAYLIQRQPAIWRLPTAVARPCYLCMRLERTPLDA